MAPWKTEIPKDKVKAIRLTNAYTGPGFYGYSYCVISMSMDFIS